MSEYIRKVNRGYQFTLPQSFRESYRLKIGDYLKVYEDKKNGRLVIEPVEILSKNPAEALESLFTAVTEQFEEATEEEIMKMVRSEIKKHRKSSRDQ